jgi:hypothetical protein
MWLAKSGFSLYTVYTGTETEKLARNYDRVLRSKYTDRGFRVPQSEQLDDYPTEPSQLESAHDPRLVIQLLGRRVERSSSFPDESDPDWIVGVDRSSHALSHSKLDY